jgi:hypothetical protein
VSTTVDGCDVPITTVGDGVAGDVMIGGAITGGLGSGSLVPVVGSRPPVGLPPVVMIGPPGVLPPPVLAPVLTVGEIGPERVPGVSTTGRRISGCAIAAITLSFAIGPNAPIPRRPLIVGAGALRGAGAAAAIAPAPWDLSRMYSLTGASELDGDAPGSVGGGSASARRRSPRRRGRRS